MLHAHAMATVTTPTSAPTRRPKRIKDTSQSIRVTMNEGFLKVSWMSSGMES